MSEIRLQSMQDLFDIRGRIERDLLKLQLVRLPQPKLIMLFERAEELRAALESAVNNVSMQGDPETAESLRQTVEGLCGLLEGVRRMTAEDLSALEGQMGYTQFFQELSRYKAEAHDLAARMAEAMEHEDQGSVLAAFGSDWSALFVSVRRLRERASGSDAQVQSRIAAGIRNMDRIFGVLEKSSGLSGIRLDVRAALDETAYRNIKDSDLFDARFFSKQLPGGGQGVDDLLAYYLNQDEPCSPHEFFCPVSYRETYPEVSQLRYRALEHFVRYGEVMFNNPGPDFNMMYYLESNDDVLDAGIPPLRHFLLHGIREGRPPCPKAGWFFTKRYLRLGAVRLGFVGIPEDSVRNGWEQFRDLCARRQNGRVEDIPAEAWTGRETGLDAFVVGAEGIERLRDGVLQTVADSGCRILYIGERPQEDLDGLLSQEALPLERVCAVTSSYERFLRWQESARPLKLHYYDFNDPERDVPFVEALLNCLADGRDFGLRRIGRWGAVEDHGPAISVVSIIYKKSREMKAFLEALNRQDLARPYEVVLVDDASPDDSVERIEEWIEEKRSSGLLNAFMDIRILRNRINSGNCTSRNRGVEAARADVVLVADGDVVMSTSSLSEHLWAYRLGDCDAVIGFFKFNMDYHDVFQWLAACETNGDITKAQIRLESHSYMRVLPNSVYNFVTRNTSFKKSAFNGEYFDESFNYTSDINSGYGEEDHEIAARLYFNGKAIRFVPSSVCVHIRHGDNSHNVDKSLSNLRNWNRLVDKHPDLVLLDRQYYQWRTRDLLNKTAKKAEAPEVQSARRRYQDSARANVAVPQVRPMRILTSLGDVPYQYELFKMRHVFTVVQGPDDSTARGWDHDLRPQPYNIDMVRIQDVNPADFDLAILTLDPDMLTRGDAADSPRAWAGGLTRLLELTKGLPRVVLCLPARGPFGGAGQGKDALREKRRSILRALLQDIHVVCTSVQEQREWGFARSVVIRQGFSPQEYPEGPHGDGCLTLPRTMFRGAGEETLLRMEAALAGTCPLECLDAPSAHPDHRDSDQAWAVANYQAYSRYLGKFSVFINPFRNPGMPRGLVEAMFTGTIPVVLDNEDAEPFIRNGVNGFIGDSVEELAECVRRLCADETLRRTMSRNARLGAMDMFNVDRCLADWLNLFRRSAARE